MYGEHQTFSLVALSCSPRSGGDHDARRYDNACYREYEPEEAKMPQHETEERGGYNGRESSFRAGDSDKTTASTPPSPPPGKVGSQYFTNTAMNSNSSSNNNPTTSTTTANKQLLITKLERHRPADFGGEVHICRTEQKCQQSTVGPAVEEAP